MFERGFSPRRREWSSREKSFSAVWLSAFAVPPRHDTAFAPRRHAKFLSRAPRQIFIRNSFTLRASPSSGT
jgi:hypothetical protein